MEPGENQGNWKCDGEQPERSRADPIRQCGDVDQHPRHLQQKSDRRSEVICIAPGVLTVEDKFPLEATGRWHKRSPTEMSTG